MKYLLAVTLALLTFGLSWSPLALPPLRAGERRELALAEDGRLRFPFQLEPGEVLHVRVEQSGVDVALRTRDQKGKNLLPLVDLPFGSRVAEELYLVAESPEQGELEIVGLDGYGRPQLEVLRLGPATASEQLAARQFAELWSAYEATSAEALQQLETMASVPRLRTLASALNGAVLLKLNRFAAAQERFEQAISGAAGDPALKAQLLGLRGRAESSMSELARARSTWQRALELALGEHDYGTAALVELDLGEMGWQDNDSETTLHHYTAAQRYYTQAGQLAAAQSLELRLARAVMRLGSSPEPLARLLRGLAVLSDNSSRESQIYRADLLRELGWWMHLEGRGAEALPLLEVAARLDPVQNLPRLAILELELGDPEAARAHLEEALVLTPEADRLFLEINLARVELAQHRYEKARERALWALEQPGSFRIRGSLPYELLASIEQNAGHLTEAEAFAVAACNAVDEKRQEVAGDDEKMEYLAVRTRVFELLIEIRLALHAAFPNRGWDQLALAAAEKLRGRRLHDLMTGKPENSSDFTSAGRRQELHQKLAIYSRGLLERFLLEGHLGPDDVRILGEPLAELETLRSAERREEPKTSEPLPTETFDLAAIRRELDPGTVLLIYHLDPRQSYGWVLGDHQLRLVHLGDSETLLRHTQTFSELLAAPGPISIAATYEERARQLSTWLIEPFAAELAQTKQVVVVAPAEFQSLPFGALPFPASSGEPLIAKRSLVVLPSASILPVLRQKAAERPTASRALAIVDDPVYDDDPRLPASARRRGPFRQLPDTAREAVDLLSLFSYRETKRFTGFEANRNQLLGNALADFRFLHFATHARTSEAPRGLVLSRYDAAGRPIADTLGFRELSKLSLNAELAVTTACSSALGEVVPGEGLLGVSQGFLSAGIPRLLLTLWPVHGQKTRALVQNFYQLLLAGKAPPEALRQAQMQLREEGGSPRDWAAFALHGDWRSLPKN